MITATRKVENSISPHFEPVGQNVYIVLIKIFYVTLVIIQSMPCSKQSKINEQFIDLSKRLDKADIPVMIR